MGSRAASVAILEPWTARSGEICSIESESIPYVGPTVPETGVWCYEVCMLSACSGNLPGVLCMSAKSHRFGRYFTES